MKKIIDENMDYQLVSEYTTSSSITGGRTDDTSANNEYWEPVILVHDLTIKPENPASRESEKLILKSKWNELANKTTELWDGLTVEEEIDLQRRR